MNDWRRRLKLKIDFRRPAACGRATREPQLRAGWAAGFDQAAAESRTPVIEM
jgi:hypothetical protein